MVKLEWHRKFTSSRRTMAPGFTASGVLNFCLPKLYTVCMPRFGCDTEVGLPARFCRLWFAVICVAEGRLRRRECIDSRPGTFSLLECVDEDLESSSSSSSEPASLSDADLSSWLCDR